MGEKAIRPKILVIEDDLNMRIYLCNLLRKEGFDAVDAWNVKTGIRKARTLKPDLIVLDGLLPNKASPEIYDQLRSDPDLSHIPVVMTAPIDHRTFCYYQKCQALQRPVKVQQPEAFFTKPPEAEDFLRIIRRLTSLKGVSRVLLPGKLS